MEKWVLMLALVVFAAGCGGPQTVEEPPRRLPQAGEEPISQTAQGGTARVALPEEPACLNPYLPRCAGATQVIGAVLESPLAPTSTGDYRPVLINEMPSYTGGTLTLEPLTVELRLREGTAFSDGEPLTSTDVRWTYTQAAGLAREGEISARYAGFEHLQRVRTPDEHTAVLVFDRPFTYWRSLLTAPVLPRHVYGEAGLARTELRADPVGSGPFLLKEWGNGRMHLPQNEDYWAQDSGDPNLGALEITFPSPEEAAERAETLDLATTTPRALEEARPPASVELSKNTCATQVLLFNSKNLSRERRTGVAAAVDRSALAVEAGGFPVAKSILPPGAEGYSPVWDGKANEGGMSGEALRLAHPPGVEARPVVRALEEAGFEVEEWEMSPGELATQDYDIALYGATSAADYAAVASEFPEDVEEDLNAALLETEDTERVRLLRGAQRQIADGMLALPLYNRQQVLMTSPGMQLPRGTLTCESPLAGVRNWGFYK